MSDYAQLQEELDAAYDRIEDLESQIPPGTRTPPGAGIGRVRERCDSGRGGHDRFLTLGGQITGWPGGTNVCRRTPAAPREVQRKMETRIAGD